MHGPLNIKFMYIVMYRVRCWILPRMPLFVTGASKMGFIVGKDTLELGLFQTLCFPLSVSPHQCFTFIPYKSGDRQWVHLGVSQKLARGSSGIAPYNLNSTSHYMYVSGQLHVPAALWPGLTPVRAARDASKARARCRSCAGQKCALHLLGTEHLFLCSLTRCLVTTELSRPPSYTIRLINLKCTRGTRHPGSRKETISALSMSARTHW